MRDPDTGGWGRGRLLVTLIMVGLAGTGMLGGLGYAAYATLTQPTTTTPTPATTATTAFAGEAGRDAIAAVPMFAVSPADARGGIPATTAVPTIAIPAATRLGPAGVPTGYPHTPEGAVGQLAAIAQTVLQTMTIQTATTVHQAWTAPGALESADWDLTAAVQAFLASAAGAWAGDPGLQVLVTPAAGQVKGADGTDWVVACVLLDVQATAVTQARTAFGHCERMTWDPTTTRWVIAPGAAPARAPSTWPGTDLAAEAGWLTWVTEEG